MGMAESQKMGMAESHINVRFLEAKNIMPVDGPSYLVGRTDARVQTMFCEGTKNRCLWTLPKAVVPGRNLEGTFRSFEGQVSQTWGPGFPPVVPGRFSTQALPTFDSKFGFYTTHRNQ